MLFCNLQMHLKIKGYFISQLNALPEHTDVFVISQHQFKNSVIIENGLVHWQPFMTHPFPVCYYCGISNLPSVASPAKINYTSQFTISHICLWCAITGHFQTLCAQFSNMTHLLRHPHIPLLTGNECQFRSTFCL